MNLPELCIRRPVATSLMMLAILVFGFFAYTFLPVSDLPNVDFPTLLVSASLPGASPETMASSVATPLEKQFSTIAGLDSMTSVSTLGSTQVTLQFTLDRDIDAAAQDVQAAITQTGGQLPRDMPSPPSFRKVNPADQPVLYLAVSSTTLPLSAVDEYAETFLSQRISMIPGVAQVQVYGSQKYAVRVQLDPKELANRQIGIDEVTDAVQQANVNLPTGTLWGHEKAVTVEASGQLTQASAYQPVIVAYRNGRPVRLQDLGRVIDSVENDKVASWFNNERAVVLAIQRQPGTNTVEVVNSIRALIPAFRDLLPPSVKLSVLYDRSVSIRESVRDVKFTLQLAVMLVILVIFLFLRKLSATLIPALALPFSIIGTFMVMYLLDYSLDNLSLMALTLSVGFVVDDAIVMLENIVRHVEMGERVLDAALKGSREVGFTILSMTLSLVAVFFPVLFMGGILGRLLHEFAVTISAAILVSGVVSLTLTPMLCSRFLREHHQEKHGRLFNAFERGQQATVHGYEITLQFVLRHKLATIVLSALMLVGTADLFLRIPKGFLPSEDLGSIFVFTEAQEGISFDAMVEHQKLLADIALQDPAVNNVMSSVGGGGGASGINTGRLFIRLNPRNQRPHVDQVIQRLRPKLSVVPGIRVFMQNLPPIRIGGTLTKSLYQFTLQSPDTDVLYPTSMEFLDKMRQVPGLRDVTSDLQIKNPQVSVEIDRDKASALGVTAMQVENALYSAYGSRQVSTIYAPNNQYRVILELDPRYQRDASALAMLYVRSSTGKLVPLNAVARLTPSVGPLSVNHLGQLPAVTISFNLEPGTSLGDAVPRVRELARTSLPTSVSTSFQGTAQAYESSLRGLGILLLMSILVIYIVLGVLYESFIHPLTILSGLPSAGFGALLTLLSFHWMAQHRWVSPQLDMELNLYGFVGVILLIGIVKKNAIMMIDFALEAQRHGLPPERAIFQGALIRFRPIMMTTMAALMGTLPIAVGYGAGGESRQPLGVAVVGGLVFSQLVTLYLTPVFYLYMESFQSWIRRRRLPVTELAPADD